MRFRSSTLLVLLLLLAALSVWQAHTQQYAVLAQESTPEVTEPEDTETPTTIPSITVTGSEPSQISAGQAATLSIFGANFTSQTTVRLVGFGLLPATLVNGGALTAALPNTIAPGQYAIEVSDPLRGSMASPNTLTVLAPTATPIPPASPAPTFAPATPVPGAPALLMRSYNVTPALVAPGSNFTLTVDIVNQGTRAAQGISVTIGTGGSFFAANGQASALLPDLAPGASTVFYLSAVAATSATAGPNALTLAFAYRDFEGQTYDSNQSLTVNVQEIAEASQVTLARYLLTPIPLRPAHR
ncbi:MAG: CARDB domain-containing protein [Anaerolineae bacterium]